ncbi:MAG: hypothetical protein AB1695_01170 [Stygiobacter sp.]|jgi:hypothetical protein|uniref:Uncharacterized protein n=1 Tax=Stygiobacter electus TaxID=3032292 RepID=A0AAE3P0J8_9BACT|nr:hypothetical protein [Stygiobacter electus]MDF1612179.1 hypothetical protein [Stygiobacter electus]
MKQSEVKSRSKDGAEQKKEALIKRDFELLKSLSKNKKAGHGSTGSP